VTPTSVASSPAVDRAGWLALLAGTAIIAWSGVLVRFLDVGPLAGGAWRMALAVPALAAWTRFGARRAIGLPAGAPFGFLALAGLAFAADVGSFHLALIDTKVANASFIGNMAPILTVVGGALLFAERPPPRVWAALGLALLGSWVMAGMAAPSALNPGDLFALGASVSYAAYLLLIKRLRAQLDGPSATLWSATVSALALAIAAVLHHEVLTPSSARGWVVVILLGVVSHALGQGLTSVAIGRVSVGLVAVVILVQPPFSAMLAWGILGETMSVTQMAGGAVILTGVLMARPK
jgi:drug/metabolite transporter (DMT)-like permease